MTDEQVEEAILMLRSESDSVYKWAKQLLDDAKIKLEVSKEGIRWRRPTEEKE